MSSLLARLIEAGTPADLVAEVALELARAQASQEAIEKRKEAEAARTERYRQRGGGQIDPAVRRLVLERDNYACRDCGSDDNLCCDHIIPVSKGGGSEPENLQVLCKPCNSKKKDRIRKRDERRLSENVQGQVRTSKNSTDNPLSLPPNENNSNPPTHTPGNTTRARKGTRLVDGWEPGPLSSDTASMVAAWPVGAIERELAKFKNYWLAKTGKDAAKLDWQRTWTNWLISADDRIGKNGNNRNNGGAGTGKTDAWQSVLHDVANGSPNPRPTANHGGMQSAGSMGRDAIGYRA